MRAMFTWEEGKEQEKETKKWGGKNNKKGLFVTPIFIFLQWFYPFNSSSSLSLFTIDWSIVNGFLFIRENQIEQRV